jgi:hypothetical protein
VLYRRKRLECFSTYFTSEPKRDTHSSTFNISPNWPSALFRPGLVAPTLSKRRCKHRLPFGKSLRFCRQWICCLKCACVSEQKGKHSCDTVHISCSNRDGCLLGAPPLYGSWDLNWTFISKSMSRADRSPFFPRSSAWPVIDRNGVEIHAGASLAKQAIALSITSPGPRRLEQRASYILHYHADTLVAIPCYRL